MNILVGMESSGIIRDAFATKGHNAVSCDLLPTERPGNHYQGDVRYSYSGALGPIYLSPHLYLCLRLRDTLE